MELDGQPNPARFTTLTAGGGAVNTDTCPNAYKNLNGRIPAQINSIQDKLAGQLNPTLPGSAAAALIATQIQQAYLKNSIANAAATAPTSFGRMPSINAINDTSQIIGQKINDPGFDGAGCGPRAGDCANQRRVDQQRQNCRASAAGGRNVVEALTYAIFPIVVLLLFLTSGRETMMALKKYIAVLIWIQLWPPLYAILNYMASIYAASELSAAANVGGGLKALVAADGLHHLLRARFHARPWLATWPSAFPLLPGRH